MSIAITEAIKTLAEAERRFNLSRTEDKAFFSEWQTALPNLSIIEQTAMNQLRRRYLYQRSEGQLLEGTVTLVLASSLLTIAGFYDPPFRVQTEESAREFSEVAPTVLLAGGDGNTLRFTSVFANTQGN